MKNLFNLMGILSGIIPPFPIDESCTVSSSTSTKSGSVIEAIYGNMSFVKLKSITDSIPLDEGCGLVIYVTQARLIVLATAPDDDYAKWLAKNAKGPVSNPQPGIYVTMFHDTVWSELQKFIARQTASYVPPEAMFGPVPTLSPEQLSFYGPLASGNAPATTATAANAALQDNQPRNLDSVEAEIADANANFDIDVPIPDVSVPAPVRAPAFMSASVPEPTRDETRPTYRRTAIPEPANDPEEKGLAVRMAESLVGLFPKKDRVPAQRRRSEPTPQNSSELDWSSLYGPKV